MIPAYCSLTIAFDPNSTSVAALQKIVHDRILQLPDVDENPENNSRSTIEIPVCYDDDFALDIKAVSLQTGKAPEEIIRRHLSTEFYVYMLGFMPGFAYLGDMPEDFRCNRKATPRTYVPAGSIGLSGRQVGIYPFETPGGWQLIGRTPLRMFDPARTEAALLKAGDKVRFKQISRSDFDVWLKMQ
jgi:inhibitor of KinA